MINKSRVVLVNNEQDNEMVRAVDSAKAKFTQRQVRDATQLRKFQNTTGLTNRAMLWVIDRTYI